MNKIDNVMINAFCTSVGKTCLLTRCISSRNDVIQAVMDVYNDRELLLEG